MDNIGRIKPYPKGACGCAGSSFVCTCNNKSAEELKELYS